MFGDALVAFGRCVAWRLGALLVVVAHALHRRVLRSAERRLLLRLRSAPVHLQLEFLHELGLFRFSDVALSVVAGALSRVSNGTQKCFCAGASQRARPRCTSGLLTVCSSPWWVLVKAQQPHA